MTRLDRRGFLKDSFVFASGALAAPPLLAAGVRQGTADEDDPEPITRTLGRTGLRLPIVSMGVMRADSPGLVRAALKAGMTHFDTAHGYQKGRNEEMLGEVLKEYPRESFTVATKIPRDDKDSFLEKMNLSLSRLKLDYVDILYLHGASSRDQVFDEEMIETMKSLKGAGKTRFLGVSTHRNEPEVIDAAVLTGAHDVVLTAVNFKQDQYPEVRKAIARAATAGVGIVAMKTMAGGFFDKDRKRPINCRAALKWVMQDANITTSIPGITALEQVAENAAVITDLTLTRQERDDLIMGALQGTLYCNGCEHCVGGCSKSLPIPDMMRAFMYTYGYGNAAMGKEVLTEIGLNADPCGSCQECTSECVKGFDVRSKIADVSRLAVVPDSFLSGANYG